jgi:hypothetical protein
MIGPTGCGKTEIARRLARWVVGGPVVLWRGCVCLCAGVGGLGQGRGMKRPGGRRRGRRVVWGREVGCARGRAGGKSCHPHRPRPRGAGALCAAGPTPAAAGARRAPAPPSQPRPRRAPGAPRYPFAPLSPQGSWTRRLSRWRPPSTQSLATWGEGSGGRGEGKGRRRPEQQITAARASASDCGRQPRACRPPVPNGPPNPGTPLPPRRDVDDIVKDLVEASMALTRTRWGVGWGGARGRRLTLCRFGLLLNAGGEREPGARRASPCAGRRLPPPPPPRRAPRTPPKRLKAALSERAAADAEERILRDLCGELSEKGIFETFRWAPGRRVSVGEAAAPRERRAQRPGSPLCPTRAQAHPSLIKPTRPPQAAVPRGRAGRPRRGGHAVAARRRRRRGVADADAGAAGPRAAAGARRRGRHAAAGRRAEAEDEGGGFVGVRGEGVSGALRART